MLAARWPARFRGAACAALLTLVVAGANAADDARESRWAAEIVPALVVGEPVYLATAARSKVLALLAVPSGAPKAALVLVHGLGVHPDFGPIGALRSALADAGYTTLAVQMPVLAADAPRDAYPATFPDAAERIAAAVGYLRAQGATRIGLVAHSLGATMVDYYLARADAAPVAAWVAIGMSGAFSRPPREPVLDVLAEVELPPVVATAPARVATLPRDRCSRQVSLPGADHYFDARRRELAATVAAFLDRILAGDC